MNGHKFIVLNVWLNRNSSGKSFRMPWIKLAAFIIYNPVRVKI